MFRTIFAGAALALAAGGAHATVPFNVSFEAEAPGVETTSAVFDVSGVESFNTRSVGYGNHFSTDFGTGGQITGTYSNLQVNNADQYGGAGGAGKYAVAFNFDPYELQLSTSLSGGVNYFGYWLSALDAGNFVTFYDHGTELFQFRPQDVIDAVNAQSNPGAYYGNPNLAYRGQDGGEPFLFVNFFDTAGSFDTIVFSEYGSGGGYESDNHTVGYDVTDAGLGTPVVLTHSSQPFTPVPTVPGVPEPASWALMLAGVGLMGAALRRRAAIA